MAASFERVFGGQYEYRAGIRLKRDFFSKKELDL